MPVILPSDDNNPSTSIPLKYDLYEGGTSARIFLTGHDASL